MWKKNGKAFVPPLRTAEAAIYNPRPDQMLAAGYEWVEPAPGPKPQPSTTYTKLEIRNAMRELGIEAKLDALIRASPKFETEWRDAQEIDLAYPTLRQALAASDISREELVAIRRKIAEARRA